MTAIYLVKTPAGERLIEADNQSKAINFVIRPGVSAKALSASETAAAFERGLKLEKAVAAEKPAA